MYLVEQHVINRSDPRYPIIDEAAFKAKNLYNAALYETRQAWIHQGLVLTYEALDKRMQPHEAYRALPAKVSQQVIKQVTKAWESYFAACRKYEADPATFLGHPKLPGYQHKTEGRNLLVYTLQALSGGQTLHKPGGKNALRQGMIKPSMLPIEVRTRQDPSTIDQVRIVPHTGFYVVEVIYTKAVHPAEVNPAYCAGIDMGITNLVALTSNKPGFRPVLVSGRPLKSINQYYNKRKAALQSTLGHPGTSKRIERLTTRRNRRIEHYLHTASKRIVDLLVQEGIGVLVIGKNDGWKQGASLGKRNNQHFEHIPHARFIAMLTYKAELVGIIVRTTEESYTSQASLPDLDPLPVRDSNTGHEKPIFSGKRIARGLYRAADGRTINADVNGSGNILRKVAPDAFAEGVEDGKAVLASLVVHPVRMVIPLTKPQSRR